MTALRRTCFNFNFLLLAGFFGFFGMSEGPKTGARLKPSPPNIFPISSCSNWRSMFSNIGCTIPISPADMVAVSVLFASVFSRRRRSVLREPWGVGYALPGCRSIPHGRPEPLIVKRRLARQHAPELPRPHSPRGPPATVSLPQDRLLSA